MNVMENLIKFTDRAFVGKVLQVMEEAKTIGMTSRQIATKIGKNEPQVLALLKSLKEKNIVTHIGRSLWILSIYKNMRKDPLFIPPEYYLKEFERVCDLKVGRYRQKITFSGNDTRLIHHWSPYVQGFSARFVDDMLLRYAIKEGEWVLDPFVGSGTVSVCAKIKRINSVGVDLMPLMTFMSKVKTTLDLDLDEIRRELNRIKSHWRRAPRNTSVPFLKQTRRQFNSEVLGGLLILKESILTVDNERIRNLFKLAFASILVNSSNLKRSPCLGYVKNKSVPKEAPFVFFKQKAEKILHDLSFVQKNAKPKAEAELILGDARIIRYKPESFDIAITSPPYVNGMDYIINYKIEMAWLDLVTGYEDLQKLKRQMIACDNISKSTIRDFSKIKCEYQDEWLEDITNSVYQRVQQKGNYRRNDMHLIVKKYFEDLYPVFRNVYDGLKEGGRFIIVIGDSLIAGVYIPADLILARMGEKTGFTIERIEKARERRSGQRRDFLLRESIVTLAKGGPRTSKTKLNVFFN